MRLLSMVVLCICWLAPNVTRAQSTTSASSVSENETNLERALNTRGELLLVQYQAIDEINGSFGTASFEVVKHFHPDSDSPVSQGLQITISQPSGYGKTNISYLDPEDVESLLRVVEYIATASQKWAQSRLEHDEIRYRSSDDFSIRLSQKGNKQELWLYSGDISIAGCHMSMQNLPRVFSAIRKANGILHAADETTK